jgi:hypothetical protein
MDLNKLTKAELISKINQKENLESKIDKNNTKLDSKINKEKIKTEITFLDVILKIKNLILSLSLIAVLMKLFKNYKTIRSFLKFANFIILTIFGMSMFEAFGLGIITKIFGELRYIFAEIITYLTDSTFYQYLMKSFNINNVVEEQKSIRTSYKKPIETDWKAEYEKAERQREIDKWKARYALEKENNEKTDIKVWLVLLLLLGGSVATWYYPDILQIFSPVWNISNLIERILRGGRDDDDGNNNNIQNDNNNDNNNDIQLENKKEKERSGSVSPAMLVYASDQIDTTPKASSSKTLYNIDPTPPAPPAPPIPSTEQGAPSSLLDSIRKGKKIEKSWNCYKIRW